MAPAWCKSPSHNGTTQTSVAMPSADLQDHGGEQDKRADPRTAIFDCARDVEGVQERNDKNRISQHAVIELHGESIFEEIAPQRRI